MALWAPTARGNPPSSALAEAAEGALLVDLEDLLAFFIPLHGEAGVKAPVEFAHVPDGGLREVIPVVGNGGDPGFQGLVLPDALAVDGELSLVANSGFFRLWGKFFLPPGRKF